jgi:hypothetical protein
MAKTNAEALLGDSGGFSAGMLTPFELACFLSISRWTLRAWRKAGVGPPFVKLGRQLIRYPVPGLRCFLIEHLGGGLPHGPRDTDAVDLFAKTA